MKKGNWSGRQGEIGVRDGEGNEMTNKLRSCGKLNNTSFQTFIESTALHKFSKQLSVGGTEEEINTLQST